MNVSFDSVKKPSSYRPIKGVSLQHVRLWGDYMEKVLLVLVISSTKSHRHVCQSRVCPFNMRSHGVITWKRSYFIYKKPLSHMPIGFWQMIFVMTFVTTVFLLGDLYEVNKAWHIFREFEK